MKSYQTLKKQLLKNKEVKKSYADLEPEFKLVELIIEQRLKKGLTQKELAEKMGTKQSAISRLEHGTYNPTISFLHKLAYALDTKLHVSLS